MNKGFTILGAIMIAAGLYLSLFPGALSISTPCWWPSSTPADTGTFVNVSCSSVWYPHTEGYVYLPSNIEKFLAAHTGEDIDGVTSGGDIPSGYQISWISSSPAHNPAPTTTTTSGSTTITSTVSSTSQTVTTLTSTPVQTTSSLSTATTSSTVTYTSVTIMTSVTTTVVDGQTRTVTSTVSGSGTTSVTTVTTESVQPSSPLAGMGGWLGIPLIAGGLGLMVVGGMRKKG